MLKPDLLRQYISQAVPWLHDNPDNLAIYVQKGRIVSTGRRSASFEYEYVIEVLVMDYPQPLDAISLPVLAWARLYQPDLVFNPDRARGGISFEADILSNSTMDVLIKIEASEAVVVKVEEGRPVIFHRADPVPEQEPEAWSQIFNDATNNKT